MKLKWIPGQWDIPIDPYVFPYWLYQAKETPENLSKINWIPKTRYVHQRTLTASESTGTSVLKDQVSVTLVSNIRPATDVTLSALTALHKEIRDYHTDQKKVRRQDNEQTA
jgi:hypothetical protein